MEEYERSASGQRLVVGPTAYQPNLQWSLSAFTPAYVDCEWACEPDINQIKQVVSRILKSNEINVSFYAEGAHNKIYKVYDGKRQRQYTIRLSLPLDPKHKTEAEVATMNFLEQKTSIPVPYVIQYSSSSAELGFEFILMTWVEGVPLRKLWYSMTPDEKEKLVDQLVSYEAELYRTTLENIGSIFEEDGHFSTGRVVNSGFWWYKRALSSIDKGPFNEVKLFLDTQMQLILEEVSQLLGVERMEISKQEEAGEDVDKSQYDEFKGMEDTLTCLRSTIQQELNRQGHSNYDLYNDRLLTKISHPDLSWNNVLVNESKEITGLIDWENAVALPLSVACGLPKLFQPDVPRYTKPDPDAYEDFDAGRDRTFGDVGDGKSDEYHFDLIEWEQTELSQSFLKRMQEVCPAWIGSHEQGILLRDVTEVVEAAEIVRDHPLVHTWLDQINNGEYWTLEKCVQEMRQNEQLEFQDQASEGSDFDDDKIESGLGSDMEKEM